MFIRYNNTSKWWEYDTSAAQNGTGPWIKLQIDYSQIINTPPGYVLPANVAFVNVDNQFSVNQTINKSSPQINFNDLSAGANLKNFNIQEFAGDIYFQARDDAGAYQSNAFRIGRFGPLYERGRATPMGEWAGYVPIWNQYGGSTPSLGNGGLSGRYTLIGKTVHFNIVLSIGSTTVVSTGYWAFSLPASYPISGNQISGTTWIAEGGTGKPYLTFVIPSSYFLGIANCVSPMTAGAGGAASWVNSVSPITWPTGSSLWIFGMYETAEAGFKDELEVEKIDG